MTDDPLEGYGAQLRDELRAATGPPPPIETLGRRHTTGRTIGAVAAVAAVAVAVLGVPQLLGAPQGWRSNR